MADFTAYDPNTRRILYSGTTAKPELLPHPAFEGFKADGVSYRVRADLNGVELKPPVGAAFSETTIVAGGTVTITTEHDAVDVTIDGVLVAESVTDVDVLFEEPGAYLVHLTPVLGLHLPMDQMIEVT